GKGEAAESKLREPQSDAGEAVAAMMQRVASQGFVRNKLTVLQGGGRRTAARGGGDGGASEPALPLFAGALAVAEATSINLSAPDARLEQIREARMKGYE